MALVHVAAAVLGLAQAAPKDAPAVLGQPNPLELERAVERAVRCALRDRSGRGALEALPSSGEMICAYLERRRRWPALGHHRLRLLADLAATTTDAGEDATTSRRLGIALATGHREAARAALDAGGSSIAPSAARLAATGVVHLAGRRGRAVFAGCLDDPDEARAYAPSVPLLRELLALGGDRLGAAALVLRGLRGEEADEGRMVDAIAGYGRADLDGALDRVRAIRSALRRRRALVAIAAAAIANGRSADAETIAAKLPSGEHRERVLLALASPARGQHLAGAAIGALPSAGADAVWWRRVEERAPRPAPELPGEATADTLYLEHALLEATLARNGKRPALGLSSLVRPWLALIDDPTASLHLLRRLPAAASSPEALDRLAELAPVELQSPVRAALRCAHVVAGALDLIDARAAVAGLIADPSAQVTPDLALLLGSFEAASSWETCRRDPRFAEATSKTRSFYDEGVSQSSHAAVRRTALLDACRASLRAIGAGASCDDAEQVVASRLRCLVNLGGETATTIVSNALEAAPPSGGPHGAALIAALTLLDPRRAFRVLVSRAEGACADPGSAAARLVGARTLDPDYARRWKETSDRLGARVGNERAAAWLDGFGRAFAERCGDLPSADSLDAIGAPGGDFALSGEALVDRLLATRDAAIAGADDPEAFLGALHDDARLLDALVALTPEGALARGRRWSLAEWRDVVARLRHGIGRLAPAPLRLFEGAVRDGERVTTALLRGAAPSVELERPIALDGTHSLRWLDKRRDFCAALRFPDASPNCFNADSAHYRSRYDTQRDVLGIWKDPLSFCFQVSRRGDVGAAESVGFAFGSFGLTSQGPVALLSGLYLRRQSTSLRSSALICIEEALCRPLGLRAVAVAARGGSDGAMPPDYRCAARSVRRLRALIGPDGTPHERLRDDLDLSTNVELTTGPWVYWHELPG